MAIETYGMKDTNDVYAENITRIQEPGYLGVAYDLKGKQNITYMWISQETLQFIIPWQQSLFAAIWELSKKMYYQH